MKQLAVPKIPIGEIVIGKRHRKDMGDIASLAKSIDDLGFLQPVVITPEKKLVAGARRLAAARELQLEEVPVYVTDRLTDALKMAKAEKDEDTQRKPLTPSEAVSLGKTLEDLERPKARARQETGKSANGEAGGRGRKKPSAKLAEGNGETGETRDKVAEAVGMKHSSYEKATAVVEAAEAEPEKFADLVERMDETGKVDGAYREMQKRKTPKKPKPPPAHPHSDLLASWLKLVSDTTDRIHIEMGGLPALLAEPDKWDWREVKEYLLPMLEAIRETVTSYEKELKKAYAAQKGKS